MAKQRNSLGLCVITAPTEDSAISWDEYKKKYGVDLEQVFGYRNGDGGGIKASFTKILAVNWIPLCLSSGSTVSSDALILLPKTISQGGDSGEMLTISDSFYTLHIDTINKTIQGEVL